MSMSLFPEKEQDAQCGGKNELCPAVWDTQPEASVDHQGELPVSIPEKAGRYSRLFKCPAVTQLAGKQPHLGR